MVPLDFNLTLLKFNEPLVTFHVLDRLPGDFYLSLAMKDEAVSVQS